MDPPPPAGRGYGGTAAAALQTGVVPEQCCIKFEVQLYTIAEATYLVDMQASARPAAGQRAVTTDCQLRRC